MFLLRPASLRESSVPASASRVSWVRSIAWTVNLSSVPSSIGFEFQPMRASARSVKSWVSTMTVPPSGTIVEVRLQRRRVHRDEHVRPVARRQDVVVGEVQLEGRDSGQRAGGRPDLGREGREGEEVVAEVGRLLGEAVTGQLHAVAGVAGDSDDDPIKLLDVLGHALGRLRLPVLASPRTASRRWSGAAPPRRPGFEMGRPGASWLRGSAAINGTESLPTCFVAVADVSRERSDRPHRPRLDRGAERLTSQASGSSAIVRRVSSSEVMNDDSLGKKDSEIRRLGR